MQYNDIEDLAVSHSQSNFNFDKTIVAECKQLEADLLEAKKNLLFSRDKKHGVQREAQYTLMNSMQAELQEFHTKVRIMHVLLVYFIWLKTSCNSSVDPIP